MGLNVADWIAIAIVLISAVGGFRRGLVLTANCRGVLAAPVLRELNFVGVSREYLSQMLFPTEIVTAHKEGR